MMQNLSQQTRKTHLKKNINTKYAASINQPAQSTVIYPFQAANPLSLQLHKKKKLISRKSHLDLAQKSKGKSNTFSVKRTQSTGVATTKGNNETKKPLSTKRKSPLKMKKRKGEKKSKLNKEVKQEKPNLAVEGIETTKSFFPLTHQ